MLLLENLKRCVCLELYLFGSATLGHLPLSFSGLFYPHSTPSPRVPPVGHLDYLYIGELVSWGSPWFILASGPASGNKENGSW